MKRWWQFCTERFPLPAHGPMILLFVYSFALFAQKNLPLSAAAISYPSLALAFLLTLMFFFQLRLFDEIKDYEHDLIHNPTRPLPRGLISLKEVNITLIVLIVLQNLSAFQFGLSSLLFFWPLTIFYSVLMYKEFFIGKYLRPHLTTYAMTHTIVTVLLGLALLSRFGVSEVNIFSLKTVAFAFSSWFIFNLFEFARKTFASEEEKADVPSYSKVFGRTGAILLAASQVLLANGLLHYAIPESPATLPYLLFHLAFGLIAGGVYAVVNSTSAAKIYRAISSLQIVLFYVIIINALL